MGEINSAKEKLSIHKKSILDDYENKVFVYVLYNAKIKNNELLCTVPREEFKYILEDNTKAETKNINNILDNLTKKTVIYRKFEDENFTSWGYYNFLAGYSYDEILDTYDLNISKNIYKVFYKHLCTYNPNELEIYLKLKNNYSRKFYNMLKNRENQYIITYKTDEFIKDFDIQRKFKTFRDLKKEIINPLIKELNQTGKINVKLKENATQKKLESITFNIDYIGEYSLNRSTYNKNILEDFDEEFDNTVVNEMYIPDKSVFTKGTYKSFTKDFCNVDFTNKYMEKALNDAIMLILEEYDCDTIRTKFYDNFKVTLNNKILKYIFEEQKDNNNKNESNSLNWY